ncbi:MAG: hypothetical protein ACKVZJ_07555 [Phycisphaerales bacterium]
MNHFTLTVLAVAALAGSARAGIVYTVQQRSITATASAALGNIVDTHSLSATDFAPFNQSIEALAVDPNSGVNGWGRAYQDSALEPLLIRANGGWAGGRTGQGCGGGGTSSFSVTFLLDAPADYTFQSNVQNALNLFSGPDGFSINQPGTFSGTLQPGEYSIQAYSSGQASFPPSGDGFNLQLTITPTPGTFGLAVLGGCIAIRRQRPGTRA